MSKVQRVLIVGGGIGGLSAALALAITVLAVNLVADGLRQALSGRQLPAR